MTTTATRLMAIVLATARAGAGRETEEPPRDPSHAAERVEDARERLRAALLVQRVVRLDRAFGARDVVDGERNRRRADGQKRRVPPDLARVAKGARGLS